MGRRFNLSRQRCDCKNIHLIKCECTESAYPVSPSLRTKIHVDLSIGLLIAGSYGMADNPLDQRTSEVLRVATAEALLEA